MDSVNRIFHLINQNGLKAKDVASFTGIAQSSFTDWKKGRNKPSYGNIVKLADFFGVTVDYLMGKTDEPTSHPEAQEISGRAFFQTTRPLTAEEYEKAQSYINFLIEQDQKETKS